MAYYLYPEFRRAIRYGDVMKYSADPVHDEHRLVPDVIRDQKYDYDQHEHGVRTDGVEFFRHLRDKNHTLTHPHY